MATSTNKYKLTKPELSEKVQVEVVNSNMDIIDATMGELQNQSTANHNKAETTAINLQNHMNDRNNPHGTTKGQLGLGNVENKSSATIRGELTMDNVTNALGYVPYTPNEVDNKLSALETKIDWKEAVDTFNDIAASYPNPQDGWTVNVKDTDYTYRFDGDKWVVISANAIPKATQAVDGLLSKEDKTNYDDANSKKHTHSNKSVLDKITQSLLDNWNAAYTHISDTIKHISSVERANWTDAYDKRHTHTNKSVLDGITSALISAWNTAKAHADSDHARIDATKVEKSETNGNIKINGTETNVYTHPGGTNPHGLTKNDIGLNNVENKSSDTIRSELTRKNVTDALGYTPPETIPSVDISGKMNRSGDTMTGALNLANGIWNNIGDDVAIGDHNVAGGLGIKGLNGNTRLDFVSQNNSSYKSIVFDGTNLTMDGNAKSAFSGITDSVTSTSSNVAASAAAIKTLNDKITQTNSNFLQLVSQIEQIKYNLSVFTEVPLHYTSDFSDADANRKSIIYIMGKIMLITINCKCQTIINQRVTLGRIDRNCTGNTVFTPAGRHGRVELSYNNGWVLVYEPMGTPLQPGVWIQGFIVTFLR